MCEPGCRKGSNNWGVPFLGGYENKCYTMLEYKRAHFLGHYHWAQARLRKSQVSLNFGKATRMLRQRHRRLPEEVLQERWEGWETNLGLRAYGLAPSLDPKGPSCNNHTYFGVNPPRILLKGLGEHMILYTWGPEISNKPPRPPEIIRRV